VFVLSEDRSEFSAKDRMEMVKRGVADLPNVTVLPTGPYLISSATFPTYFLKEREKATQIQCLLDIEIFTKYYVPKFGIHRRYVGTEPLSPMTAQYNEALAAALPQKGVQLRQVPRLEQSGIPVSASAVRANLNDPEKLAQLLPQTTLDYLLNKEEA
jgi:[citrate (pro-3S)-lyase] ligase